MKTDETPNGGASASETTNTGEKGEVSQEKKSEEVTLKDDKESTGGTLPINWGNIANIEGREHGGFLNMDDSRRLNVKYYVQQNTSSDIEKVDQSDLGRDVDPRHITEQYVEFNGQVYSLENFEADRVGTGELVTKWDNGRIEKDGFTFYTGMTIYYVDDVGNRINGFGNFGSSVISHVIVEEVDLGNGPELRFNLSNQPCRISTDYGRYIYIFDRVEGNLSGSEDILTGHQYVTVHYKANRLLSEWIIWDDNEDKAKLRLENVTVHLFAGDHEIASTKVLAEKNQTYSYAWYYDFGYRPIYENGAPIKYSVSEEPVQNYSTRVDGLRIWNKYNPPAPYIPPTKTIRVSKVWVTDDGGTPAASVDVQILKNGEAYKVVTLSDANGWNYSEAVIDDGAKYTAQEVTSVDGFVSSVTEDGDTITITNDDVKKPDKPVKPDKPTKPDKPVKPTKPDKPAKPKKPAVSVPVEQVKANVPKTGDENHMGLYGGMLVLAAAGAAVLLRLRRKSGK